MGSAVHEVLGSLTNLRDILSDRAVSDARDLGKGLQCSNLDCFIINADRAEKALHDDVSLLLVYEVRTCRWDRPLKCLDGNAGQLDLALVDVADRWMQDHTDLLLC